MTLLGLDSVPIDTCMASKIAVGWWLISRVRLSFRSGKRDCKNTSSSSCMVVVLSVRSMNAYVLPVDPIFVFLPNVYFCIRCKFVSTACTAVLQYLKSRRKIHVGCVRYPWTILQSPFDATFRIVAYKSQ